MAAVADLVRPVLEGKADDSPLRVLRDPGPRADRTPLFVFHPAGGSTSVYQPLTDLLPPGQPVFGFDRVEALMTVEDKVEHYLSLMRRAQAEGPYHLLGWSFGGCLAYQTAIRLRERGEHVGYLGLIDTILPAALPGPSSDEILMERFARFAEYIETAYGHPLRLPYEEMAAMVEADQIETLMRHVAEAGLDMSPGVLEHQRTSYVDARIGERYRPRPCRERVVLYRAGQDAGPDDRHRPPLSAGRRRPRMGTVVSPAHGRPRARRSFVADRSTPRGRHRRPPARRAGRPLLTST